MSAFFLNPAILGFAALASLPVLIHLLNRQRYKRVRWAAMPFLMAAFQKTYRRLRLENLLLLLLRTAAVLLAVLAMARPFTGGAEAGIFQDPVHLFLLVDDSFSMGHRAGAAASLDRARTLLSKRLESLPNRSLATVVLASRLDQPLVRDAGLLEAREALAGVVPSDLKTDLSAALSALASLLEASPMGRREVLLATDLQATAWPPASGGLPAALQPLARLRVPLKILDVGKEEAENTALVSARVLSRVVTSGRSVLVEGSIRHFGNAPRRNLEALLLVDGIVRDRQVLDRVDPGEEASARLVATLPDPGPYALEIRLAGDALALDDCRHLGVRASPGLEMLVVDGDPMPEPEDAEAFFLTRALSPQGSLSPVRVTERSLYRFGPQDGLDLRSYDLVALLNVGALDPAQAARLEAYVREGGHLLVSLGDNTVISEWNQLPLLPARLTGFRAPTAGASERFARLKIADPDHPAAASLKHSPGLDALNIRGFVTLEPLPDPEVRIPWSFTVEGTPDVPAILERPLGSGRVVLVATSLDNEWGDLPLSFDYVALVHDLAYATARGGQVRETLAGQAMVLELPGEHAGQSLRLVAPDGRTERVVGEALASRLRIETPPLARVGPYRIVFGNPEEVVERFAGNPDPAESDLARLAPESLTKRFPGLEVSVKREEAGTSGGGKSGGVQEHWRGLFLAVGILLALESILAWRFGRE